MRTETRPNDYGHSVEKVAVSTLHATALYNAVSRSRYRTDLSRVLSFFLFATVRDTFSDCSARDRVCFDNNLFRSRGPFYRFLGTREASSYSEIFTECLE